VGTGRALGWALGGALGGALCRVFGFSSVVPPVSGAITGGRCDHTEEEGTPEPELPHSGPPPQTTTTATATAATAATTVAPATASGAARCPPSGGCPCTQGEWLRWLEVAFFYLLCFTPREVVRRGATSKKPNG